jgi:hypothetical protein
MPHLHEVRGHLGQDLLARNLERLVALQRLLMDGRQLTTRLIALLRRWCSQLSEQLLDLLVGLRLLLPELILLLLLLPLAFSGCTTF